MKTFKLCHGCACEVVNDDVSGRDFWDLSEAERAARDAKIEEMGYVVMVEECNTESRFDCFVCGGRFGEFDSECGHIFESVDLK